MASSSKTGRYRFVEKVKLGSMTRRELEDKEFLAEKRENRTNRWTTG